MTTTSDTKRIDVYSRVTSTIIEQLERGVRPWMQPWKTEYAAGRITRPLRHNGQPYNGINVITLWMECELRGFACPFFLTFPQAKELGGFVKKGEHGSPVVYASTFKKTDTNDNGAEVEQEIPFLKQYTVFNAEQVEGFHSSKKLIRQSAELLYGDCLQGLVRRSADNASHSVRTLDR